MFNCDSPPKVFKPRNYKESKCAKALIEWSKYVHIPIVKIANEGKRSIIQGRRLKFEGLAKGFPDYIILKKTKAHEIAFMELKDQNDFKISKEQRGWIDWLTNNGYYAFFAHGLVDAINKIKEYENS